MFYQPLILGKTLILLKLKLAILLYLTKSNSTICSKTYFDSLLRLWKYIMIINNLMNFYKYL